MGGHTITGPQLFWARIKHNKAISKYKNFQSAAPAQFWRYNQNKQKTDIISKLQQKSMALNSAVPKCVAVSVAQLFWVRIRDIKAILRYKNFQSAAPAQFWRYNQNKNCSETSVP